MFDIGQFKSKLLQKIEPGRLAEAEKSAETQGISLTEALASSLILDFADLGECCSKVTGLPYVPLLPPPPSDVALRLMSPQCASSWETFPVRYDPGDHMLWLAIHDPDQIQKLERIFRFFMQPQQLGFTIAPDVEIARACHKHLGVFSRADRASVPRRRAQDEPMLPSSKPNAESEKRLTKRDESKRTQRSKETKRLEPPYEDMYRSLVSAITLLVRREHEDSPEGIHEVRTRVRYCQLLAGRRNLNRVQTDGLVLAAWILGMKDGLNVSRQVVTPYNLEGILLSDDRTAARAQEHRVEKQILSLVQAHEDLRNQGGLHGRDVSKVRRALQLSWSSAPSLQDLLEAFLQILIDDEFLEKMGSSDGRILILDPEEESTGNLGWRSWKSFRLIWSS